MYPRTNYEMTEKDLENLYDACKPTHGIMVGGYVSTPQENANRAWAELGRKMGFDSDTVRPIPGKDAKFFSAAPSETESQKKNREDRESEKKRRLDIAALEEEISVRQEQLTKLRKEPI